MPTSNREQDRLLEHNYDGIQEYDNPMPRWWVWIFWATIVFAIVYGLDPWHVLRGPGRIADYNASVADAVKRFPPPSTAGDAATLAALGKNPQALAAGKEVFVTNCAPCHRPDGGGVIGPNLTDDYWLHGGTVVDIHRDHHQRRARQGHAELGQDPQAGADQRRRRVRVLRTPRHQPAQSQAATRREGRSPGMTAPPAATDRVLPTLNEDGSRRWIRPKPSPGKFWRRRRAVAYGLMVVFFIIPYLRMSGKPLVLLDLPDRQFTLVRHDLPAHRHAAPHAADGQHPDRDLPDDCAGSAASGAGGAARRRCTWSSCSVPSSGCSREAAAGPCSSIAQGVRGQLRARRMAKYGVYLLLSLFLAHTFLAYFVGDRSARRCGCSARPSITRRRSPSWRSRRSAS